MFGAWHKHRYNIAASIAIDLLAMLRLRYALDGFASSNRCY